MSAHRIGRPRPALLLALVLAGCVVAGCALAGCGGGGGGKGAGTGAGAASTAQSGAASRHLKSVTLILDFTPNAVHAGIYRALAAGYYREQGIDLHVVIPSATTDTLKLIDAGSAQIGLADGSDVASLIARGGDAQAVMAIVQRPLGGLIGLASERLRSPADLQGRSVGITGVPSDTAVLDTEVRHAGGDPRRVHVVTVGFNGGQALAAGRIAAFTGFIPDDGVQLQVSGHPIAAFALDRYGGPAYPGLVAFTTRHEIAAEPGLVRGFVAATVHGYEDTLADPTRSLSELLAANPTLEPTLARASLEAYLPLFAGRQVPVSGAHGGGPVASAVAPVPYGMLWPRNIAAMSDWMLANRLIAGPIAPARYGTNEFIAGA